MKELNEIVAELFRQDKVDDIKKIIEDHPELLKSVFTHKIYRGSLLFLAIVHEHLPLIECLLKNYYSVFEQENGHDNYVINTPFLFDNPSVIDYFFKNFLHLIEKNLNTIKAAMLYAAHYDKREMLIHFLEKHKNIDFSNSTEHNYYRYRHSESTLLLTAAQRPENLELVKFLLQNNYSNINEKNKAGQNIYYICAKNNNTAVFQFLIKNNYPGFDEKDNAGKTPLYVVQIDEFDSDSSEFSILKFYLKEATHVPLQNPKEVAELAYISAECNYFTCIKFLYENCKTIIDSAIKQFGKEIVKSGCGGDVEATPLLTAAKHNNMEIVEFLLKNQYANINERNKKGNTPLLEAARSGSDSVVKFLLENKYASMSEQNNYGWNALFAAIAEDNVDIVRFLINNEYADLSEKLENENKNVLEFASGSRCLKTLNYLLQLPQAHNILKESGYSVLEIAAKHFCSETVNFLLKKGAYINPDFANFISLGIILGRRHDIHPIFKSLHFSAMLLNVSKRPTEDIPFISFHLLNFQNMNKPINILTFVKELGENCNGRDLETGNTALHFVLENKNSNPELIIDFFYAMADFNIKNHDGISPFDLLLSHFSPAIQSLHYLFQVLILEKHCFSNKETMNSVNDLIETGLNLLEKETPNEENVSVFFAWGKYFSGTEMCPRNAEQAYKILSRLPNVINYFKDAHALCYHFLSSKKLVFKLDPDLDSKPYLVNNINMEVEDPLLRPILLHTMIKHGLYGQIETQDLDRLIAGYIFGDEEAWKDVPIFEKSKPDDCLTLIENLKRRQEKFQSELSCYKTKLEAAEVALLKSQKEMEKCHFNLNVIKQPIFSDESNPFKRQRVHFFDFENPLHPEEETEYKNDIISTKKRKRS